MCKSNCDHPELRPKDGECSDDLIEKCHGKNKNHPCTGWSSRSSFPPRHLTFLPCHFFQIRIIFV